ncbi:hypothetical protein I5Q34_21935 [Streptomyces sp. AV19]|uniref:DUF7848 domain-containing protein n=1 Tax=Streptomyces sp. AV19 TaxID=2793068 RepID=UPI0018FEC147|nr:hypothetical protein [Streptomyces sp. AV19]MBH1936896.1 hypothetical protein [Streptomyces sp. AV19]MDG4532937.1 hypothetical protein [Streptomyces sp. AV19]
MSTAAEYSAECRTPECDAEFSILDDRGAAESWMYAHMQRTGHNSFWQTHGHPVIISAPPGSILADHVVEHGRVAEPERCRW